MMNDERRAKSKEQGAGERRMMNNECRMMNVELRKERREE